MLSPIVSSLYTTIAYHKASAIWKISSLRRSMCNMQFGLMESCARSSINQFQNRYESDHDQTPQGLNELSTSTPTSTTIMSRRSPSISDLDDVAIKSLHRYDPQSHEWQPYDSGSAPNRREIEPSKLIQTFALISWNVDFSRAFQEQRLKTALDHLQSIVEMNRKLPVPLHTLILIQELYFDSFGTLLEHPFVRDNYDVTDCNCDDWIIHYGSVTLVPRAEDVKVTKVFKTPFEDSRMGREAVYVDLEVGGGGPEPRRVRIANTHLESLSGFGDIARPKQLAVVTSHLSVDGVFAGIVAGDMNPIGPQDVDLPENLGLSDAWEICHPPGAAETVEEATRREEEGHTWGYQPRSRYAPKRMDKVLFKGPLAVKEIERFGVGLKVSPDSVEGKNVWASDHYGLHAKIEVLPS